MAKEAFMSYDPWSEIQTRNGMPATSWLPCCRKLSAAARRKMR